MNRGIRKLLVIVLYMVAVTAVAIAVVINKYDTLMGVAGLATGMATGIGTFMWGNAQEHKYQAKSEKKEPPAEK